MRVVLHLDWDDAVKSTPPMLRRIAGFDAIKRQIAEERDDALHLHAFTYAFLRRAKNVDLYVEADDREIQDRLRALRSAMAALETFERDGTDLRGDYAPLKPLYLALRRVVARPSARDERRVLVHLVMNGPCSDADFAKDLGISENLAVRVRKALQPALTSEGDSNLHRISDEAMPVVLFVVRETTGVDPLAALDR